MVFREPFDLEQILIVNLAGTIQIFVFLSMICIAALAGRFRMPNSIALVMFALFGLFIAQYMTGLYVIVVLLGSLATFYSVSRFFKY